ncbi:unnamed protein product [Strongylus vulgaris]|uniref:Uncharacterized protein n=1 Tax=Strongylus vulgaris TaxID=40348 RepID=A0A3P7J8B3_STRVU|nr:unnamed protein product [Strongylus vulgaris]
MNFSTAKPIDNYLNFTDIEGVYCGVVQMERDVRELLFFSIETAILILLIQPECATCSGGYVQIQCQNDDTLQDLIDKLVDKL